MKKITLSICLFFTVCLLVQLYRQWPRGYLHVVFCDVGQGDAILLSYFSWQMLIDAGSDDQVLNCLGENMPFWDKTLEVVLITHTDHDHIGGLSDVFANYQARYIYLADVGESEGYKNMLGELKSRKQTQAIIKNAFLGQKIEFSPGGEIFFLSPETSDLPLANVSANHFSETLLSDAMLLKPSSTEDPNERSVVLLLKFFDFEILLMADASEKNELALIEQGLIKKVEGLKVGHHGSKTSSSESLLKHTQPEFAVISCGLNNKFGHPSPETLLTLTTSQVKYFRTDELGTVKLITNGKYYWFDNK